ncbi:NAD-dependent epimerase/dehydratase family protein [Thermodesulfobacteriota bacterium]
MEIALVTGSAGLIGSEAVRFFSKKGFKVVGIDNDMRKAFFGKDASTDWSRKKLEEEIPDYSHYNADIRDEEKIISIFKEFGTDIKFILHTAAQPSHDWAAKNPYMDFSINATGTLVLLENTRKYSPDALFIFTSTNKVYGDVPNLLPLKELETRWEIDPSHPYYENGIDETMSIDQSKHSLFGASKVAADILVQEYGRYFDMKTACFRGGCLTGPGHSGTMLHGFMSYLMKCALTGEHYTIYGYKGKQVRDNIHSYDLVNMFWHFYQNPKKGEVYNAGGGRHCSCSIIEAITLCEEITGKKMNYSYSDQNRSGDHIWWISDIRKFQSHYPGWYFKYDLKMIMEELCGGLKNRV